MSAAIMTYYQSRTFRTLKGGTPAIRRAILERFREAHGDKLIAAMPPKLVPAMLETMQPHAARNWLKALRHLMAHCVATDMIEDRHAIRAWAWGQPVGSFQPRLYPAGLFRLEN
jgi:hypothetical protein